MQFGQITFFKYKPKCDTEIEMYQNAEITIQSEDSGPGKKLQVQHDFLDGEDPKKEDHLKQ